MIFRTQQIWYIFHQNYLAKWHLFALLDFGLLTGYASKSLQSTVKRNQSNRPLEQLSGAWWHILVFRNIDVHHPPHFTVEILWRMLVCTHFCEGPSAPLRPLTKLTVLWGASVTLPLLLQFWARGPSTWRVARYWSWSRLRSLSSTRET